MLKKLNEKRGKAFGEIDRLQKVMDAENRDLNAEEEVQWDEANEQYDSLTKQIKRVQRADELGKEQDEARKIIGDRDTRTEDGEGSDKLSDERASVIAVNAFCRAKIGRELTDEHKRAVKQVGMQMSGNGFDVRVGMQVPRNMAEARAMSSSDGSLGGFTVREGFVNNIEVALLQFGGMRRVAQILRTRTGADLPWPTSNDTSNEGSWVGENETMTDGDDVEFGQQIFRAHKVSSKPIKVPYELVEDSEFNILEFVSGAAGERIARTMASGYTTGDGAAKPTGIVPTATLGVTTASPTAITGDEIIDLAHAVDPAYREMGVNVGYALNDQVLKAVRKLKDNDGQYIWKRVEDSGLRLGMPDQLYGFPVLINQNMASTIVASASTMLFGDLYKYKIRDVNNVRIRILTERYAESDQFAVLVIMRTDGHLLDAGTNPVQKMVQHA